jgi:hypothetical protein
MPIYKLIKQDPVVEQELGKAIFELSRAPFSSTNKTWVDFNKDARAWLNGWGFRNLDVNPPAPIPASVDVVPVYDTSTKVHVVIPWWPDLQATPAFVQDDTYGGDHQVFMARYFMRRCR